MCLKEVQKRKRIEEPGTYLQNGGPHIDRVS